MRRDHDRLGETDQTLGLGAPDGQLLSSLCELIYLTPLMVRPIPGKVKERQFR
jgi:hypothetical protein